MFIRLSGYFGTPGSSADALGSLAEAIIALDPSYHRIYEYSTRVMTMASRDVNRGTMLRAIALLDRGAAEFPDDWRLPALEGEIYAQDLETTDPKQRRAWDEKATLLTESAIRKPGAPSTAATWAATMRTKLGEHDRAVEGLREMILITPDVDARKLMLDKLAKLDDSDESELASELFEERVKFEAKWKHDRPGITPTMYVLLGPRLQPGFDLTDLATGGRDLVGSTPIERLEPLE